MITEFENNEKNRVLVITHKTKPVLERLNQLIKEQKRGYDDQHEGSDNNIYHYMNTNQVYITLSDTDVKCKYNLLFDELEIHDVFWNKMKRHSPLFIASNHSFSIETNLNEFYDNTKNKIQLAQKYQNTKCCCHPIVTSLDLESHSTLNIQCIDVIDKTVINAASRKIYCKAIEKVPQIMSQNISISGLIMKVIWALLGDVVGNWHKKDNNQTSYQCRIYKCN